ncbi:flagellar basal-body rod protein FlgF [Caldanaerobacter subterraneus]|uniref:Flagellar basal body and hook protein n=1 Tax=Caldanaerobacter subterraneus subsp. pacificus DSM 12653 TaxID=391606 RepID=B7R633_9THEO|nr:flagellar basal-body rod protein FlgF [Caldanaerobacter subterraneus]KKC30722.1 flagellar basal body and hook protein [Caldanaerobacter subterraneus subsp. pacificus DSM 12653]
MIRGLYTAASGMLAQTKVMDVLANNLANVNTVGYKKDVVVLSSFPNFETIREGGDNVPPDRKVGRIEYGVLIDTFHTVFEEGPLMETTGKLDFAIDGNGFFVVNTPQGERYTRDGAFTMNADGYLVTKDGYLVLGENGPIRLSQGDVSVDENGNIINNGQLVDRLRIVDFDNYDALKKQGDNLFYLDNAVNTQIIPATGRIKQGFLEGSNVNSVKEMVNMISVMRNYESNQKVVTAFDETLGKAVNEVGRV